MSNKILQKDNLLSLKEVAKRLRVSERSIFRYIHKGKLRATKIGYWRIAESDLEKFLLGNVNVAWKTFKKEIKPKKGVKNKK